MRLRLTPILFALLAVVPSAACGDDAEAGPPVVLARRTGLREREARPVRDPHPRRAGRRGAPHAHRRRRRDPYGAPGATRDDGVDNVKVIPGWDGVRSRREAVEPSVRREAARAHRHERVVRARRRRGIDRHRHHARRREGHDRDRRARRRPELEQDDARVRAPAGRALLRPRRALRERRPPRAVDVLVGRGGLARRRRGRASRATRTRTRTGRR